MYMPDDGYVMISVNCAMGNNSSTTDAYVRIGIGADSTTATISSIDRSVVMKASTYPQNWTNAAITQMTFLSAGSHTFYFLVYDAGNTDAMLYYDPTIAVVYIDHGYYGYSAEPAPETPADPGAGEPSGPIKK